MRSSSLSRSFLRLVLQISFLCETNVEIFSNSTPFFLRLQLYDLVEHKVQGDGNCQVSLFCHGKHALYVIVMSYV